MLTVLTTTNFNRIRFTYQQNGLWLIRDDEFRSGADYTIILIIKDNLLELQTFPTPTIISFFAINSLFAVFAWRPLEISIVTDKCIASAIDWFFTYPPFLVIGIAAPDTCWHCRWSYYFNSCSWKTNWSGRLMKCRCCLGSRLNAEDKSIFKKQIRIEIVKYVWQPEIHVVMLNKLNAY